MRQQQRGLLPDFRSKTGQGRIAHDDVVPESARKDFDGIDRRQGRALDSILMRSTALIGFWVLVIGLETLPLLYGTEERRTRTKVTGIGSGLVAAGKGFAFGIYDGVTGMVRDPMRGAQTEVSLGLDRRDAQSPRRHGSLTCQRSS